MASESVEGSAHTRFSATKRVSVSSPLLGDQSIAYYDDGGAGPAVVFVHPNSCSTVSWERQLANELPDGTANPLARCRRIAFDLPGHGETQRESGGKNPYSLPFYADALVAFANALQLEGAFFVGHSLGGHAVIEAGARLPSPKGALIFGSPPVTTHEQLGGAFFPMPGGPHFLTGSLSERDVCHWQASVFYSEIPAWFAESVARTDPAARADLAASLGVLADEVGMVREYPCPIGLIQGQFERTVRQPYLESLGLESKLWRNAIQVVDESNHFTQFDAAPAFNALVAEFIAEHV